MIVLAPAGDIAMQQSQLLIVATALMLLIIVPVIVLTVLFAWRYRSSNTDAVYTPNWSHSAKLEYVIWGAPLLIIIILGTITWITTHTLDPYRPLSRISEQKALAADTKPMKVQVVALDWKWLFIYPDLGIATVNELAVPIDTPIEFFITASTIMNSFSVPALAGQIYAMPGMETKLHAVINKAGKYNGFSANYSGEGFSNMRFKFLGMQPEDFAIWLAERRSSVLKLDQAAYMQLAEPTVKEPVHYYSTYEPGLFNAILMQYMDTDGMCMSLNVNRNSVNAKSAVVDK
jgi:cytochrome o ubiquinol oxidase subunit 2